eukprot:497115-Amphidinium_carterae.1
MSLGEVTLDDLSLFDDETDEKGHTDSEWIICPFPEVPNTRDKKSLAVSQISGEGSTIFPVVVLDPGEDSKEGDQFSVQAEASMAGAPATVIDDKTDEDHPSVHVGEKWFIEVCCEENSLMSQQAEKNGWTAFRITQANPLQSVETQ